MARFLIALGSSHWQGQQYIERALEKITHDKRFTIVGKSRIYKNSASQTTYNSMFFNCAFAIHAPLHPHFFYRELAAIEVALGRIRNSLNCRRTIDIDVLMSLDFTYISSNFCLPHRETLNRNFFVIPAIEALKSADWPAPIILLEARSKFGSGLLSPA